MAFLLPGVGEFGVSVIANLLSAYIYDKLKERRQKIPFELADLQELIKEAFDSVIVQLDNRIGARFISSHEAMIQRFKKEVVPEIVRQVKESEVDLETTVNSLVEEIAKRFFSELHEETLRLEKLNEELDNLIKSLSTVIKQYPLALPIGEEKKETPRIKIPTTLYIRSGVAEGVPLSVEDIYKVVQTKYFVPEVPAHKIAVAAYQKLKTLGVSVTHKMLDDLVQVLLLDMEFREFLPPVRKILSTYLAKMNLEKPAINVALLGHIAVGKSTIIGHLLYDLGIISDTYLPDFAGPMKFAWIMDMLREERQKGMTIRASWIGVEGNYIHTLWNLPGHRSFIKSAILGMSESDHAVFVVSAARGEFEAGIGPGGQLREHAFLAYTHRVASATVLINKMDHGSAKYDRDRFEECSQETMRMLRMVGFDEKNTRSIPTSGLTGENIVRRSKSMKWYDGPTFWERLNSLDVPTRQQTKFPLRIPLLDFFTRRDKLIVLGTVKAGRLRTRQELAVMPQKIAVEADSIEKFYQPLDEAVQGDFVGIGVSGIHANNLSRGSIISDLSNLPRIPEEFVAQTIIIYHPTAITQGYAPTLHVHTASVPCRIVDIISRLNPRTGEVTERSPSFLKTGDGAILVIRPLKPLAVDTYADCPSIGTFSLRDMGTTIAAGVVKEIAKER